MTLKRLTLLCLACTAVSWGPGTARSWAAVDLAESTDAVTISNRWIQASILKDTGQMVHLTWRRGPDLMGESWYWNINSEGLYESLHGARYRLVRKRPDLLEIAFEQSDMAGGNLQFDVHYVLTDDTRGCYAYAVLRHPAGRAWSLEQARCVVRCDPSLFTVLIADDRRQIQAPSPEELAWARAHGGTLEPQEATLLPDGRVHDKYLYSDAMGEHHVHGWRGDRYGLWMISPSNAHQNGGPTSQELTVHQTETTPVILRNLQGAHYGSGVLSLEAGEAWEKLYGPFLLYINEADDPNTLWADAKRQAAAEQDLWPYRWMDHPLYPLARGRVRGRLLLTDGSDPNGAWLILAQPAGPHRPDWQRQARGYQFFDRADGEGRFEIRHVRPGRYSLIAVCPGVPEHWQLDNIVVDANETLDLGTLAWTPERFGRLCWQIGRFDRTAGEYRYGDRFHDGRSWGLWQRYREDFPDDVRFVIGQSREREDWNYTLMAVERPDGGYDLPTWRIVFDLDRIPPGTATLTIGIAASRHAGLEVRVNGALVENDPSLQAGAACVRNSIYGTYQLKRIAVPTTLLQTGENQIGLRQTRARKFSNVMFDALRLELPGADR